MAPVSVVESTQKSFFFFFLQFILIFIFISSFSVFSHRRFGSRSRSAALGMEVGTPTWGWGGYNAQSNWLLRASVH